MPVTAQFINLLVAYGSSIAAPSKDLAMVDAWQGGAVSQLAGRTQYFNHSLD